MITINLLPWRDYAKARQIKFFKMMALLTMATSLIICILIHHHFKVELNIVEERIIIATKKSEKYANTPENAFVGLYKIVNKTRRNHDQLKKMLHAMFVYSTIDWDLIEAQKGIIKVYGAANLMTLLLSFVDFCEKQLDFSIVIKSIKILSPFDAIKFQVQVDRVGMGSKNNGLD